MILYRKHTRAMIVHTKALIVQKKKNLTAAPAEEEEGGYEDDFESVASSRYAKV